jgi:hypothetical protein
MSTKLNVENWNKDVIQNRKINFSHKECKWKLFQEDHGVWLAVAATVVVTNSPTFLILKK